MAVVKARHPKRGEVHLIGLDPTPGREIKKTRPCVIISPDELNAQQGGGSCTLRSVPDQSLAAIFDATS